MGPGGQIRSGDCSTRPDHQPDNPGGKQETDEHGQPGQKPDLLLVGRQLGFSPANIVLIWHGSIYTPGCGVPAIRCSPHVDLLKRFRKSCSSGVRACESRRRLAAKFPKAPGRCFKTQPGRAALHQQWKRSRFRSSGNNPHFLMCVETNARGKTACRRPKQWDRRHEGQSRTVPGFIESSS